MRGINKTILVGNAGKDPEYKELADGTPVVKLSLATTEVYRLKDNRVQADTQWHTVIAWRGLAGLINRYVKKGSLLYVEGKIRYRKYEDREGQTRVVCEIIASEVVMLEKKSVEPRAGEPTSGDEDPFG